MKTIIKSDSTNQSSTIYLTNPSSKTPSITPNVIQRAIQNPSAFVYLPETERNAITSKMSNSELDKLYWNIIANEKGKNRKDFFMIIPINNTFGTKSFWQVMGKYPTPENEQVRLNSYNKIFGATTTNSERQTTIQQIQQLLIKLTQLLQQLETESKPSKA